MTKKFMNTYLTTRGTPFTDIDGYQTIDFIREFDGRDARMNCADGHQPDLQDEDQAAANGSIRPTGK